MKLSEMKKEELELLSNKDITFYLLEEQGKQNTAELFKSIVTLLELPSSTFEEKIGDYYTSLTTDKRFIMLEDGCWDLRSRHTSDKIAKIEDEEDDDEEEDDYEPEPRCRPVREQAERRTSSAPAKRRWKIILEDIDSWEK